MPIDAAVVSAHLADAFIAAPGTTLRREDHQKVAELVGFLREIEAVAPPLRGENGKGRRRPPFVLVDAAAGKSALGLLAAKLLFAPAQQPMRVVVVERDPERLLAAREAAERLRLPSCVEVAFAASDLSGPNPIPTGASLVVALHACGAASDAVIARAIEADVRRLLLAPCCVGPTLPAFAAALERAAKLGFPSQAPVRQRFARAFLDAERTLVLEAAGYETVVAPFVAPTISPENLLWRARRVREPGRMREASDRLARLRGGAPA